MSDASNDPISIGDLFAAFGAGDAGSRPQSKSSAAPSAAKAPASAPAASDADESDVIDVMSALGITPSASMRSTMVNTQERRERSSAREEQIREQQIRSQQWQRELEEQQRRRQMQAERDAAVEEPVVEQQPQAQAQPKKGFGEDTTRIAEPSFLDKRKFPAAAPSQAEVLENAQEQAARAEVSHGVMENQEALSQAEIEATSEAAPEPAVLMDAPTAAAAEMPVRPDQQVTIPVEEHAQPAVAEPQAAPVEPQPAPVSTIKPISESAAAAVPQRAAQQTGAMPQAQAQAVPAQQPVVQQPVAQPAPTPTPAPAPMPIAPAPIMPEMDQPPMDAAPMPYPVQAPAEPRQKRGVNKGNVLGIILIIIALICAVLTVMLLTGTIDATTFSNLGNGNISGTQQLESSAAVFDDEGSSSAQSGDASHAVYGYVVRGTDGGTYQATETASFGANGKLESSSIVIDVPDEAQAQGLLDQLKADFGDAVADSSIDDGEVRLTININRDDLDVDSYTELLSSNMAEFKVIETGVTK